MRFLNSQYQVERIESSDKFIISAVGPGTIYLNDDNSDHPWTLRREWATRFDGEREVEARLLALKLSID